jgi:hypothetical protein
MKREPSVPFVDGAANLETAGCLSQVLHPHGDVEPVERWRFGDTGISQTGVKQHFLEDSFRSTPYTGARGC